MVTTEINASLNGTVFSVQLCSAAAPVSHTMYVLALFVMIAYAIPLNTWVLWLGIAQAPGKRSSEILSLNLAAMAIYTCTGFCMYLLQIILPSEALALICTYFRYSSVYGSAMFHSFISLERYLAVVHPVIYRSTKMHRFRLICACLTWPFALGLGVAHLSKETPYQIYVIPLCVALLMAMFSSLSMLKSLSKPKPGDGDAENMDRAKKKAFIVISLILAILIICYITYVGLQLVVTSLRIFCIIYTVRTWFFFPMFVTQPLLYLYKAGKLQQIRCF